MRLGMRLSLSVDPKSALEVPKGIVSPQTTNSAPHESARTAHLTTKGSVPYGIGLAIARTATT